MRKRNSGDKKPIFSKIKLDRKKVLKHTMSLFFIVLGAALLALSMHMFTIPAKLAPGGVSGLSSIIQVVSGFPAAYSMILINIPLVILSFKFLSKKFTYLTLLGIALSSGFLQLYRVLGVPGFVNANELLVSALAGGVVSGTGIGLMVKNDSSTGGTEALSLLIQKKFTSVSISWIVLIVNIFIITIGVALYFFVLKMTATQVITVMLFSFLQVFVASKAMEIILNGMSSAVKFEVVTNNPKELSEAIFQRLNRGVTIIESYGAYTKEKNSTIICIVTRMQISQFKKLLKEVDPAAFAFSIDTREVLGIGFRTKK